MNELDSHHAERHGEEVEAEERDEGKEQEEAAAIFAHIHQPQVESAYFHKPFDIIVGIWKVGVVLVGSGAAARVPGGWLPHGRAPVAAPAPSRGHFVVLVLAEEAQSSVALLA